MDAAKSMFPFAASRVLIACSLLAPRSISRRMFASEYRPAGCAGGRGTAPDRPVAAGAPPRDWPLPGKGVDVEGFDDDRLGPGEEAVASCSAESSAGSRALSGSSCSDRKLTSRPWIRRQFFARSIHAWCALSMSRPSRRSTSRPYENGGEKGSFNCMEPRGTCPLTDLHDGERTWEMQVRQFHLSAVDSPQDFRRTHSSGDTRKSLVN